eukprot:778066_1
MLILNPEYLSIILSRSSINPIRPNIVVYSWEGSSNYLSWFIQSCSVADISCALLFSSKSLSNEYFVTFADLALFWFVSYQPYTTEHSCRYIHALFLDSLLN